MCRNIFQSLSRVTLIRYTMIKFLVKCRLGSKDFHSEKNPVNALAIVYFGLVRQYVKNLISYFDR